MAKAEYRSAIRSRKLINEALADLLQEKPLDKITVTDVVRRAGINRGTFYAHYMDIPDVLQHLIIQVFSRIRDAISEKQPRKVEEVPQILLLQIQEFLEEDLEFCKKIMNSNASVIMQEQLVGIVLDYLLQMEKDFGVGDHEEFVLIMRFGAGGLINLYRDWLAGELPITLEQLTGKATRMLLSVLKMESREE